MTQEKQKLRRIVFPESRNVHGKPTKNIPVHSVGRPFLKDLELTFIPDLEVVEVVSSSHPTLLIPRDQVFSMEPEQDRVHPGEVTEPVLSMAQLAMLKKEPGCETVAVACMHPAANQEYLLRNLSQEIRDKLAAVPEPVPTPVVKPPEGARSNLDAPLPVEPVKTATAWTTSPDGGGSGPDLRPPPKGLPRDVKPYDETKDHPEGYAKGVEPPKESRFGEIGRRKPGRPKKSKS